MPSLLLSPRAIGVACEAGNFRPDALIERAGLFRAAVEAAGFGILISDAKAAGRPLVYANPAFEVITGYSAGEALGRSCAFLQGSDRRQPGLFRLRRALAAAEPVTVTLRNYRKSGELFWNELTITPIRDDDGTLTHFVGVQHDVTARVEAEGRIVDVLDRVGDAFFAVDRDWRFTYVNRRAEELLDRDCGDLVGARLWDAFPTGVDPAFKSHYQQAMRQMAPVTFVEYFAPLSKWFEVRAFPGRDGLTVYFRDVTEQRIRETRLQYLATHDTLTGLPNRERCVVLMRAAIEAAARAERELAVLYFNLDGFKEVNDSIGHTAGDEVLRQITARMLARRPPDSALARFSGDEFVMLVDSRDAQALQALAAAVLEAVREPIEAAGRQLRIGASAGVAVYPEGGAEVEALLVSADLAMLEARQGGRGRVRLFDASVARSQRRRMDVLQALRLARFDEQVTVHYQPKLRTGDGRLAGLEALTRWTHPRLGTVPPAEFIPLAEESGEIVRLGDWVLRSVCRQLRDWLDAGLDAVPVSVNVSVGQIEWTDFLAAVDEALADSRIPARLLQVEITESLLMRNFGQAGRVLAGLAERGIEVHLDDFGTGYSSLASLWQLPVACIKLDRSFTRALAEPGGARAVVGSVIGMAHALGKSVVAEGVETAEQDAMLREMRCDQLQGFLYSRPLAPQAATDLIAAQHSSV